MRAPGSGSVCGPRALTRAWPTVAEQSSDFGLVAHVMDSGFRIQLPVPGCDVGFRRQVPTPIPRVNLHAVGVYRNPNPGARPVQVSGFGVGG